MPTSMESFDAFYASTRDRLLHEAYALTGDIAASRSAVRDAFVLAWHHWRKVGRFENREAWIRPVAHNMARRRHTARPWHRDKSLDPEVAATLEALSTLSRQHRHILILAGLSPLSVTAIAKAVGVPLADADRALERAIDEFVTSRGAPEEDISDLLMALRRPIAEHRWPRGSIIRRAGTARRRTHTLAGVGVAVVALLVSGSVVASGADEPSNIAAGHSATQAPEPDADPGLTLAEDELLDDAAMARFGRKLTWGQTGTSDNLAGDGLVMPCQKERFADPGGIDALVRAWKGEEHIMQRVRMGAGPKAGVTKQRVAIVAAEAMQLVELSGSEDEAAASYERATMWYADCLEPRVQLLSTHQVDGVGDAAIVFRLRSWAGQPRVIDAAIARSGQRVVTTVVRARTAPTKVAGVASGLADAVNAMCGTPGAGTCASRPKATRVTPLAIGKPAGLLAPVDLPPVSQAVGPWVGTEAERARTNFAATRCDRTSFRQKGIKRAVTRTFLFPEKRRADQFGLTQTVGTMQPKAARKFVGLVRDRIRSCAEANLGTKVTMLRNVTGKDREIAVWALSIEVSDARAVPFLMGIVREGRWVSQVGFTPDGKMAMSRPDFVAVVERALARLANRPGTT